MRAAAPNSQPSDVRPSRAAHFALASLMVVACACGQSLPDATPTPSPLASPTPGDSGTLREIFGDDWTLALVSECEASTPTITSVSGIDLTDLPCVDREATGPNTVLFDANTGFVRWYADTFFGGYVPGCYGPSAGFTITEFGNAALDGTGRIECPE